MRRLAFTIICAACLATCGIDGEPAPSSPGLGDACDWSRAAEPIRVDGILAAGEWDGAAVFGPQGIHLGDDSIEATVHARVDRSNLAVALEFDRDLSGLEVHTVSVRIDASPVDGSWNAGGTGGGDDGVVANLLRGWFFDEHFSTAVQPNQGQVDDAYGGTVDGAMTASHTGSRTVVEITHPLDSGDSRDIALADGDMLGLAVSTYLVWADGREARSSLAAPTGEGGMGWVVCTIPAS